MSRRIVFFILILCLATPVFAQYQTAKRLSYGPTNPGQCNPLTGDVFFNTTAATRGAYYCSAANTWTAIGTINTGASLNIPLASGTAAAPSLNFSADPTTGLYRSGAGGIGLSSAGTAMFTFSPVTITYSTSSRITANADGLLNLTNNAQTDFTRLTFGPEAVTHPAITRSAAVAGQTQGIIITKGDGTNLVFANLGAATNGSMIYCSDCTIANPCAGGGTGSIAKRLNGVWVCN